MIFLILFIQFLSNARRKKYGETAHQDDYYKVPVDCDQSKIETHQSKIETHSLDNYLLNEDIIRLLKMTLKTPPGPSFYARHKSVASAFFSKPFPEIASKFLGYPVQEDEHE